MSEERRDMTAGDQASLFWRLLSLQGAWNFQAMQGLGFVYGLEPWLKRCYEGRPEEQRRALARHHEYFNTHPYLAPLVAGMVAALEQQMACEPEGARESAAARLDALKNGAAAALAGIGDNLFWTTLRPFCAAAALLLLSAAPQGSVAVAAAAYLAAFNLPALALRWRGLRWGYVWQEALPLKLKGIPWQGWIRRLRWAGLALAVAGVGNSLSVPGLSWVYGPPALAAVAVFLTAKLWLVSSARLYLAACALGALASAAGWA